MPDRGWDQNGMVRSGSVRYKIHVEAFITLRVLVAKAGTTDKLAFFLPDFVSQIGKVLHVSKTMISGATGSMEAMDQALRSLTEFLMTPNRLGNVRGGVVLDFESFVVLLPSVKEESRDFGMFGYDNPFGSRVAGAGRRKRDCKVELVASKGRVPVVFRLCFPKEKENHPHSATYKCWFTAMNTPTISSPKRPLNRPKFAKVTSSIGVRYLQLSSQSFYTNWSNYELSVTSLYWPPKMKVEEVSSVQALKQDASHEERSLSAQSLAARARLHISNNHIFSKDQALCNAQNQAIEHYFSQRLHLPVIEYSISIMVEVIHP
uniref:TELO2-interacting protein 1 homolog isoform X1 n=1 Tax=Tanacetum cinerariifolium TaxID=118510 RepID=A0A699GP29_TANCI|nr:TELO2-interacting protein 1 homolog isoform X1 [Tanacetum cinerariifolium]